MKRIYTYMCLLLLSVLSFAVTGCDDDDDDDVAKDLIELIVNKPVIRIGQNEEAKVNVVVGNGNYTVRSFNTAIATATVSGELITVKSGSQNGATTVEVMDGEGVVANISVNVGVFELEVNEPEVILEVAGEKQLIVSMGNFSSNDELSYEVEDETVVSMVNTDQFRPFNPYDLLLLFQGLYPTILCIWSPQTVGIFLSLPQTKSIPGSGFRKLRPIFSE